MVAGVPNTLPVAVVAPSIPAGLAAGVCVLNSPPRVEVVLVRVGLTAPPSPIPRPIPPPPVAVLLGMGMANPIAGATVAVVPGAVLVVPGKAGGKVVAPILKPPLCVDAVLVPNAKPVVGAAVEDCVEGNDGVVPPNLKPPVEAVGVAPKLNEEVGPAAGVCPTAALNDTFPVACVEGVPKENPPPVAGVEPALGVAPKVNPGVGFGFPPNMLDYSEFSVGALFRLD